MTVWSATGGLSKGFNGQTGDVERRRVRAKASCAQARAAPSCPIFRGRVLERAVQIAAVLGMGPVARCSMSAKQLSLQSNVRACELAGRENNCVGRGETETWKLSTNDRKARGRANEICVSSRRIGWCG